MTEIKTMAVVITKENYPIAVACLAGGFASIPSHNVLGSVLVINEIHARRIKKERSPITVIENSWMAKDVFDQMYQPKSVRIKDVSDTFIEVERI